MRFESRDLKPYGDYVRSVDLIEGHVYFRIGYLDKEMLVPEMIPLVFIGRELDAGDHRLYFQDAASYLGGQRYPQEGWVTVEADSEPPKIGPAGHAGWFETMEDREFSGVFEFEQGLNELLSCSLRRRDHEVEA
jgi:hypothetical protein